jgi:AAA15 family ATPase/GTPase
MDITTIHKVLDEIGNEGYFEFDFEEESEGTQRLFSLIGLWIDSLNNGRVLVVDELDTKLHHLLNVFLIKLFNDSTQNKNNAQLIFTTHNTNLLDQDIFRRDQIWFTEKNPSKGSTDLYSLIEFSPRKDKDIQKGYLTGRYGAIPFISDDRIF